MGSWGMSGESCSIHLFILKLEAGKETLGFEMLPVGFNFRGLTDAHYSKADTPAPIWGPRWPGHQAQIQPAGGSGTLG
jgi:hypothetical protein